MYLEEYARQHGLRNIRHFWDDGYTALLSEIEAGHVATLIVKDLSRFGRNYLQVGYYTEVVFPKKGVRFIAINNCNRAQLYTVPVQLRSCRRLDEIGLAFRSPSRFHPKENCIFLALLRSYPFAALTQDRSAPRSVPGQRAQLNTIPDRSSRAILSDGLFRDEQNATYKQSGHSVR